MCFTSKSFRPEPDMLDARTARAPQRARGWTGQLAGGARGAGGCRTRLGSLHPEPMQPGGRRAPPGTTGRGQQSRAARRRSGPQDLRVGSPPAGSRGRRGKLRAEIPRSPLGSSVLTVGGTTLMLEKRERGRSERSEAQGGGGSWLHLPGMRPRHRCSWKGVGSPVLAAEFSAWRAPRGRERKRPKSPRSAPLTQPAACTCAPVPRPSERL